MNKKWQVYLNHVAGEQLSDVVNVWPRNSCRCLLIGISLAVDFRVTRAWNYIKLTSLVHLLQYTVQRHSHMLRMSHRVAPSKQKKSLTFLHKTAGNMLNKFTFIDPNSQRTSGVKNILQYKKVQVSYMMIWERVHAHHSSRHSSVTRILLSCHNWISMTTQIPWPFLTWLGIFPDFSLTLAEFRDISRFPEIPEKWQPCLQWKMN